LRQITSGPHYNVSPVPLPDGRLAFISSRTPGTHTVCQSGPSTHVHVMNRDGSGAQDLSANTLSDFGLGIMADGRLLFTRWEYVDVTLTYRQSLWTQRPDGCQLLLWFGNTILDPATFWQAREIPGRYAAVCTFTSHHHSPYGAIGLVTNRNGPEAPRGTGFRWITREFPANLDLDTFWAYRDPFPIHENRYLVSYGGGGAQRFRIYLLDDMDNKVSVYDDPATNCFSPQPLRPRPVPMMLEAVSAANAAAFPVPAAPPGQPAATNVPLGRLMLTDVYQGLGPEVARGRVASIRIMEQMPKTVDRTWNFVMDQGPLMSASTYYCRGSRNVSRLSTTAVAPPTTVRRKANWALPTRGSGHGSISPAPRGVRRSTRIWPSLRAGVASPQRGFCFRIRLTPITRRCLPRSRRAAKRPTRHLRQICPALYAVRKIGRLSISRLLRNWTVLRNADEKRLRIAASATVWKRPLFS